MAEEVAVEDAVIVLSYPYSDMANTTENTNGDPSGHGRCLPTFVGSDDEHEFSKKNSL